MEVHTLTSQSPDLAEWLPKLLQFSRQVFEPGLSEDECGKPSKAPQLQIETWREKLALPNAAFFYTLDSTEAQPIVLGYFFAHARPQTGESEQRLQDTYHIYLAAVHPSARGKGIFPLLLNATKNFARATGYKTLTVATVPDRFQRMYGILSKSDSGWVLLEEKTTQNAEGTVERKVLMGMPV